MYLLAEHVSLFFPCQGECLEIGKVRPLLEQSCTILSSFKIMVIFNTSSADVVLISADVIMKITTILNELRIAQLCSKIGRTLSHYIEVAQGGVSSKAIHNWLWIFSLFWAKKRFKKSSLLVYSGLLVFEFSKKCHSACLFRSARLLGTSEYFVTRAHESGWKWNATQKSVWEYLCRYLHA